MARDKEAAHRKAKRRGSEWDESTVIKKDMHVGILIGIIFCVVGGAMLASSFFLSWVNKVGFLNEGVIMVYITEMINSVVYQGYLIALIIPIGGAVIAMLAAMELLGERGVEGLRRISPPAILITSVVVIVFLIVVILKINDDFLLFQYHFGPGLFVATFGSVLAVAGGLVIGVDHWKSRKNEGKFVAASGSKEMKALLRPTKKHRSDRPTATEDKELKEEMLAAREGRKAREARAAEGECCPSCNSPIQPNWKLCPICGEQLQ